MEPSTAISQGPEIEELLGESVRVERQERRGHGVFVGVPLSVPSPYVAALEA